MAARRIAVLALVAAACSSPPPPAPKPDAAAVKAMLAPWWAKWVSADTACNAAALAALSSSDVSIDARGMAPLKGRANLQKVLETSCKTVRPVNATLSPSEDWADGDHLYERGSYTESNVAGNKGNTDYGRYFVMFDKDSTGNILMAGGTWFVDSSPAMKMTKAPAKAAPAKGPAKAPARKVAAKKS